jgi:mannose-6-phosphate isomerase class I
LDHKGKPRQLHIDQALQSIDFDDVAPKLVESQGELLVRHELFEVQQWNLDKSREAAPLGQFAIVCCLTGQLTCANLGLSSGEVFLVPAQLQDRQLKPIAARTSLLRVTIPR